jgi:hypothetical protein
MKVYLKFNLDQENENFNQERDYLQNALMADKMKAKIDSLYNDVFRVYIKYKSEKESAEYLKIWNEIRDHFEGIL